MKQEILTITTTTYGRILDGSFNDKTINDLLKEKYNNYKILSFNTNTRSSNALVYSILVEFDEYKEN